MVFWIAYYATQWGQIGAQRETLGMPEQVNAYIAGEWRAAEGDQRREIRSPADGQLVATVAEASDADAGRIRRRPLFAARGVGRHEAFRQRPRGTTSIRTRRTGSAREDTTDLDCIRPFTAQPDSHTY